MTTEPANCSNDELAQFLMLLKEGYLPCTNSPPSTSSLAPEGEYSQTSSSDTNQSPPSKSMSIASKSYQQGKKTVAFHGFPSLTMSLHSTDDHGKDSPISSPGDSHARTSPQREKALELLASEVDSGVRWHALCRKFDRDSCSWKTHRCLFSEVLPLSSLTLPGWGMMRDGELFRRKTPSGLLEIRAYITNAKESGSSRSILTPFGLSGNQGQGGGEFDKAVRQLSTPRASTRGMTVDDENPRRRKKGGCKSLESDIAKIIRQQVATSKASDADRGGRGDLLQQVPTPKAHEPGMSAKTTGRDVTKSTHLTTQVAVMEGMIDMATQCLQVPTPTASDHKSGKASQETMERNSRPLSEVIGGSLNPAWVAWLQWFPIGWESCEPLETRKFRAWLRSHGGF